MSDQTDQTSTAAVERVHAPGSPVDHLAPPGSGVTLCGYLGAYPRPLAAPRRLCTLCELLRRDRETAPGPRAVTMLACRSCGSGDLDCQTLPMTRSERCRTCGYINLFVRARR